MIFSGNHPVISHYHLLRQIASGLVAVLLSTLSAHSQKTDSCFAGVFITQDDFLNNPPGQRNDNYENNDQYPP